MEYCFDHGIPHSKFLEWSNDDQDKVLAWINYRHERCPNCGTFPDEWLDREGKTLSPPPHMVSSIKCYGCKALEDEKEMLSGTERGLYFYLTPWREDNLADGP
jgi:hypothetical protein